MSRYPAKFDDPLAEYLDASDGHTNASPALQAAIDRVEQRQGSGIVFVPSGTYRLDDTVHLWRGIRLIGFGPKRPVFVLPDSAPACDGEQSRYMVHFCDARTKAGEPIKDAANTTFYSAVSNIDFRIGQGNPSAVCVRYHVAQLCSLEYIDFHVGGGRAAVEAIGNQIRDCRFVGGQYGILGGPTSAGWQSLVMDCVFEDQREACITADRSGLTIIRCQFRRSPHAIVVPVMRTEQLYMRDSSMEQISGDAIALSEESNPCNQANIENLACRDVPTLLRFRPSTSAVAIDSPMYRVRRLSHGLHIEPDNGRHTRHMDTRVEHEALAAMPELSPAKANPPPQDTWVNMRSLGAAGDGVTDDSDAFRRAIAEHQAIYVPMGRYRVTGTLELRTDTALIGLHPQQTQLVLPNGTAGFGEAADPKAVLVAPCGGETIVRGLCVDAGVNLGAVAIKWLAGPRSLLEDVWFEWGGHGADPKGQSHLHSLWIADGGAGMFRNIWSPNIGATTGIYISDTEGPGEMCLVSVEHHLNVEVRLRSVRNWQLVALQTEENYGSHDTTAVTIDDCRDLEFDNLFMYRVMSMKTGHPHAIRIQGGRRIIFRGLHCFSWGKHPFDNAIHDAFRDSYIPEREATLVVM